MLRGLTDLEIRMVTKARMDSALEFVIWSLSLCLSLGVSVCLSLCLSVTACPPACLFVCHLYLSSICLQVSEIACQCSWLVFAYLYSLNANSYMRSGKILVLTFLINLYKFLLETVEGSAFGGRPYRYLVDDVFTLLITVTPKAHILVACMLHLFNRSNPNVANYYLHSG